MSDEVVSNEAQAATVPAQEQAAPSVTEATAKSDGGLDFAKLVAERLGGGKAAEKSPAEAPEPTAEAPKPAVESPKPVATPVVDDIEARLAALHEANRRAAEARKLKQRDAELAKREAEVASRTSEDTALVRQLRDSKSKGDVLSVLVAAGWTRQEIADSPLVVNLLEQIEKSDPSTPGKPLTESDIERKFRELKDAEAAEVKKRAEEEAKEAAKRGEIERAEYFMRAKVEFKAGDYPALREAGVTLGALDNFRANYMRSNPNHAPTPRELLDIAEKDLVAYWEKQAELLAKYRVKKPAQTVVEPAKKPTAFQPAAQSAKRTITSRMMADSGGYVPPVEAPVRKPYSEKEKEMKDAFVSRFK